MERSAPPGTAVRRSPLHEAHLALGARMVPFGGWEMPLAYGQGTVSEHRACRRGAVAFDVSHLGTVRLDGPGAFDRLQAALSNDLRKVAPGRAQYTHLLADDGSVADDLIVWWVDPDRFDVMPNASNTQRVRRALGGRDTTAERAVVAVQGPRARQVLGSVAPSAATVRRFEVAGFRYGGADCLAAGTGYTGEDGVECAVPVEVATELWEAVLGSGAEPAGLGARDTLRLEAGLPLHGHELGPGITPLQAGLGWVVGWDKGDFTGRAALEEERRAGPRRLLRGLVGDGRQPLRDGAAVLTGDRVVGTVTSGNFSPMLGRGIGLGLLEVGSAPADGEPVTVDVRGRLLTARLARPPFWPPGGGAGGGTA